MTSESSVQVFRMTRVITDLSFPHGVYNLMLATEFQIPSNERALALCPSRLTSFITHDIYPFPPRQGMSLLGMYESYREFRVYISNPARSASLRAVSSNPNQAKVLRFCVSRASGSVSSQGFSRKSGPYS